MPALSRELFIGIAIGVLLYWAFMHFRPQASGGQ